MGRQPSSVNLISKFRASSPGGGALSELQFPHQPRAVYLFLFSPGCFIACWKHLPLALRKVSLESILKLTNVILF